MKEIHWQYVKIKCFKKSTSKVNEYSIYLVGRIKEHLQKRKFKKLVRALVLTSAYVNMSLDAFYSFKF